MNGTFFRASEFNADLSSWDTCNLKNVSFMFYDAQRFRQSIDSWNLASVTYAIGMFDTKYGIWLLEKENKSLPAQLRRFRKLFAV